MSANFVHYILLVNMSIVKDLETKYLCIILENLNQTKFGFHTSFLFQNQSRKTIQILY